jgi:hypothetical protein
MNRTLVAIGLVTATSLAIGPAMDACGDKSLSAGGIRMQRALAARYPASVLAYVPAESRLSSARRELNLQETLQRVGHTYQEVASLSALEASVATGRFNIIVADVSDSAELQRSLDSSPSRVVVVPVAYRLTKEEEREAAKHSRFLIKAPSQAAQYLTTIANAVASRSTSPRKG